MNTSSASAGAEGGVELRTVRVTYDDHITRNFLFASTMWGIVGMLVGAIIALQLAFWPANVHAWLSFGRLRPLRIVCELADDKSTLSCGLNEIVHVIDL